MHQVKKTRGYFKWSELYKGSEFFVFHDGEFIKFVVHEPALSKCRDKLDQYGDDILWNVCYVDESGTRNRLLWMKTEAETAVPLPGPAERRTRISKVWRKVLERLGND